MSFISNTCPNCGGHVKIDSFAEIGYCIYCGSKISLNGKGSAIHFKLSEYVSEELLPSSDRTGFKNRSDMELLVYANGLISDNDSYLGWFYKGACLIADGSTEEGLSCWTRSVMLCNDSAHMRTLYDYMLSILVHSKIQADYKLISFFSDYYVRFTSIRMLDTALSRSEHIDYRRYDIYYGLIDLCERIAEHDLIPGEQHSLVDVLGNVYTDALESYCDFDLLLSLMQRITVIERRSLLRLIRYMDTDGGEPYTIDPDTCTLDSLLDLIDPYIKECRFYNNDSMFSSIAEMIFHHCIYERLTYHSTLHSADDLSKLKTVSRSEFSFDHIRRYEEAGKLWSHCRSYKEYSEEIEKHGLKDIAYSSVDMMMSSVPETKESAPVKKGLFRRRG